MSGGGPERAKPNSRPNPPTRHQSLYKQMNLR